MANESLSGILETCNSNEEFQKIFGQTNLVGIGQKPVKCQLERKYIQYIHTHINHHHFECVNYFSQVVGPVDSKPELLPKIY